MVWQTLLLLNPFTHVWHVVAVSSCVQNVLLRELDSERQRKKKMNLPTWRPNQSTVLVKYWQPMVQQVCFTTSKKGKLELKQSLSLQTSTFTNHFITYALPITVWTPCHHHQKWQNKQAAGNNPKMWEVFFSRGGGGAHKVDEKYS